MNRTLQDRLVKAMRAACTDGIKAAYAFVVEYITKHNTRFARPPVYDEDAHPPLGNFDLERAFSSRCLRTVMKDLTFSFAGQTHLIKDVPAGLQEIGPKVSVELRLDGTLAIYGRNSRLNVRQV